MSPALTGYVGLAVLLMMLQSSGGFAVELLAPDLLLAAAGFAVTRSLLLGDSGPAPLAWYRDQLTLSVPLLILVPVGVLAVAALAGPFPQEGQTAGEAIAGLVPGGWWDVAAGTERPDRIDPLGPLWLVALLVQFCLVWPVLLTGLYRLVDATDNRRVLVRLAPALAAAAVAAWLVGPLRAQAGAGAAELALGGHVRATEWLFGAAAAAVAVGMGGRQAADRDPWVPAPVDSLGLAVVGTGLLGAMAVIASVAPLAWMQYGGPGGAALGATALLLAVHLPADGPLARALGRGFPLELGRMAFALLLLHAPVFWMVQLAVPAARPVALLAVGGVLAWLLGLMLHDGLVRRIRTRWPRTVLPALLVASSAATLAVVVGGDRVAGAAAPGGAGDRVLVFGGAAAGELATALGNSSFTVVNGSRPGCGLLPSVAPTELRTGARTTALAQLPAGIPGCAEMAQWWARRVVAVAPDVIVLDLSADAVPRPRGGPAPCDPQFRAEYRDRVADALRIMSSGADGRNVLLAIRHGRIPGVDEGSRRCLDALLVEAAATYREVMPLDLRGGLRDLRQAELDRTVAAALES